MKKLFFYERPGAAGIKLFYWHFLRPLKCHALLEGLPGVPDPKPLRNRTRTQDERMNPVVKKKMALLKEAGKVPAKDVDRARNRAAHQEKLKATAKERMTRRRTKFDFDLWDAPKPDTKVYFWLRSLIST